MRGLVIEDDRKVARQVAKGLQEVLVRAAPVGAKVPLGTGRCESEDATS